MSVGRVLLLFIQDHASVLSSISHLEFADYFQCGSVH